MPEFGVLMSTMGARNKTSQLATAAAFTFGTGFVEGTESGTQRSPFGFMPKSEKRPPVGAYLDDTGVAYNSAIMASCGKQNQSIYSSSPQFSMNTQLKETDNKIQNGLQKLTEIYKTKIPAPGAYDMSENMANRFDKVPSWDMGEPAKENHKVDFIKSKFPQNPGAGEYPVAEGTLDLPQGYTQKIANSTLGRNRMCPTKSYAPAYSFANSRTRARKPIPRERKFKSAKNMDEIDGADTMKGRHAFDRQKLSSNRTAPCFTMGGPGPEREGKPSAGPGGDPDRLTNPTTFGKQTFSKNASAPAFQFGPGFNQ